MIDLAPLPTLAIQCLFNLPMNYVNGIIIIRWGCLQYVSIIPAIIVRLKLTRIGTQIFANNIEKYHAARSNEAWPHCLNRAPTYSMPPEL